MPNWLNTLLLALTGYVLGSLPFALIVSRWAGGVDVREVGSGHAGVTNVIRAAGWLPGMAVAALDLGKGYLAVWLAGRFGASEWTQAAAAALVVAGHCWPLFARFRGGMGMAPGCGAIAAAWPMGFFIALGLALVVHLAARHTARGNLFTGLLLGPVWFAVGAELSLSALGAAVGLVVAFRALSDWSRLYSEWWLDRGSVKRDP